MGLRGRAATDCLLGWHFTMPGNIPMESTLVSIIIAIVSVPKLIIIKSIWAVHKTNPINKTPQFVRSQFNQLTLNVPVLIQGIYAALKINLNTCLNPKAENKYKDPRNVCNTNFSIITNLFSVGLPSC